MPRRKSAANTKADEAQSNEPIEAQIIKPLLTESKSKNSEVEKPENPVVVTEQKNSDKCLLNQFKCYTCGELTEYVSQAYEETTEPQTMVVTWRELKYYIKCDKCGGLNKVVFMANRNQPNGVDAPPTLGKPTTVKEDFYLSLAGEFVKNNTKFVNEVLRQLVTLNTALLAGTIAFMNKDVIREGFKIPIIICFLGGLVIAFKGVFPYSGNISFLNPVRNELFNKNALEHKLWYIKWSGISSLIGFLLIIFAGIIKILRP